MWNKVAMVGEVTGLVGIRGVHVTVLRYVLVNRYILTLTVPTLDFGPSVHDKTAFERILPNYLKSSKWKTCKLVQR